MKVVRTEALNESDQREVSNNKRIKHTSKREENMLSVESYSPYRFG